MPELYSREWFIEKFEAIPTEAIGKDSLKNHCACHHVGVGIVNGKQTGDYADADGNWYITEEAKALIRLLGGKEGKEEVYLHRIFWLNDGSENRLDGTPWGDTPKERILNKLESL